MNRLCLAVSSKAACRARRGRGMAAEWVAQGVPGACEALRASSGAGLAAPGLQGRREASEQAVACRAAVRSTRGFRRVLLPVSVVLALAAAGPAHARDLSDVPSEVRSGPTVLSSDGHFLVHYAQSGSHAVPEARARELAAHAEDAWRVEMGQWGWPAPLDDGDGRLDIYVYQFGAAGQVTPDASGGPASSWMAIDPDYVNPVAVSHELLHMSQNAITADYQGQVLTEGLGYWAGFAATGNPFEPDWAVADPARPFGCTGWFSCVSGKWAFFQFLAERYGHGILIDGYRRAPAVGGDPEQRAVPAIDAALRARGSTLADAFSAYTAAVTTVGFDLDALRTMRPEPAAQLRAGCRGRTSRTVPVDHLTARWVKVFALCFSSESSLRLSVSWPGGLPDVRPEIGGNGPIHGLRFRRRAGSLTTTIPATAVGDLLIGLPNPSLSADGQPFGVTVQATRRPMARVRVVSSPRALRSRSRTVVLRVRSSRSVWLGLGFSRLGREDLMLVRAPRGQRKLRVPIPHSLAAGRYDVSVRGGLMTGRTSTRVKLAAP